MSEIDRYGRIVEISSESGFDTYQVSDLNNGQVFSIQVPSTVSREQVFKTIESMVGAIPVIPASERLVIEQLRLSDLQTQVVAQQALIAQIQAEIVATPVDPVPDSNPVPENPIVSEPVGGLG